MKFIDYKIKEISKVMAGGDKPKVCSDVYSDETPIPIYSNGMENEGLYGYTDVPKVEGDTGPYLHVVLMWERYVIGKLPFCQ